MLESVLGLGVFFGVLVIAQAGGAICAAIDRQTKAISELSIGLRCGLSRVGQSPGLPRESPVAAYQDQYQAALDRARSLSGS